MIGSVIGFVGITAQIRLFVKMLGYSFDDFS